MKTILLALLLSSSAFAQQFTVQTPITVVCPGQPATASGSNVYTCPGGVVPQCPSPPGPGPCSTPPPGSISVGDLLFTGQQVDTQNVTSSTPCIYGRIVIPLGADGMTTSVVALVNGSANAWKMMTLTKSPCDFSPTTSPSFAMGQTVTLFLAFTTPRTNAVTVLPGQIFYVSVKNQLPFGGGKSCTLPSCDFAFRLYPPS